MSEPPAVGASSTTINAPQPAGTRGIGRVGLLHAFGAYGIWGFMPLFFKLLADVPAHEIVAHRIVWSIVLLIGILALRKRLALFRQALTTRATLLPLIASATLIAINWLVYIWAINHGYVIAASLGYFLNPLLNVVLGRAVLKERLGRAQWVAVGLAATGVAVLALGALDTLWISLTLAASFGTYGLIRKMVPVGPMVGLASETVILLPLSLGYLAWLALAGSGGAFLAMSPRIDLLLIAGGAVTAIPLLMFASAAKRMKYATLGLIQYMAPTIQFLLGVFLYREPLTTAHMICFPLIWAGLALYSWDAWRDARREVLNA